MGFATPPWVGSLTLLPGPSRQRLLRVSVLSPQVEFPTGLLQHNPPMAGSASLPFPRAEEDSG